MDSFERMQLLDLARTLTRNSHIKLEAALHSYLDTKENIVTIRHFWEDYSEAERFAGRKSDVFLRSIGNAAYYDSEAIEQYLSNFQHHPFKQFAKQILAVSEDIRLENICRTVRPGTVATFQIRRSLYSKHFLNRLKLHLNRREHLDALFVTLFLYLLKKEKTIDEAEYDVGQLIQPFNVPHFVNKVEEAISTIDIVNACTEFIHSIDNQFDKDMGSDYFSIQANGGMLKSIEPEYEEQVKRHQIENDDMKEMKSENKIEKEEKLSTWHREMENPKEASLQHDLERGTRTNISAQSVRESDSADGELSIVYGKSRFSKQSEYTLEQLQERIQSSVGEEKEQFGRENRHARAVYVKPKPSGLDEKANYNVLKGEVSSFSRSLVKTIKMSMEHKRAAPRVDMKFGRIKNRKLLRLITDRNTNIFYKKNERSHEIDACFTLLVDCSASMYDKMEETKKGIVLFHETLKSLRIPHSITGFWEDADGVRKDDLPNYFKTVISYEESLLLNKGPAILQLSSEQDNRDGFAIRVMTSSLMRRGEKQKILFVFSDGEPSASSYNENGIMDTYEAVNQARKNGVEVINILLGSGELNENDKKTMNAIYGNHSIKIPDASQLPERLKPFLQALLQKMIS